MCHILLCVLTVRKGGGYLYDVPLANVQLAQPIVIFWEPPVRTSYQNRRPGVWKGVRLPAPDGRPRLMRRLLLRRQPPLLPAVG